MLMERDDNLYSMKIPELSRYKITQNGEIWSMKTNKLTLKI